jgi:hypothetical protein
MRSFGYGISVVVLLAGLNTALAAGTGFTAGSYQISEATMYCDKPEHNSESNVVSTTVHPIWQVDTDYLHLGYIEDDFAVEDLIPIVSLAEAGNGHPATAATDSLGVQLDNGWSLGLTYETIDASLKLGYAVDVTEEWPVYEGPMFVATLKFR